MRRYYVSKDVLSSLINEDVSVYCYVQTQVSRKVLDITSAVTEEDSAVGRHDLAILYKNAILINELFQLSYDFVDYGAGGYDYGDCVELTQAKRKTYIKDGAVLIYAHDEFLDKKTQFYLVDVLAEDIGKADATMTKSMAIDMKSVIKSLSEDTAAIFPISKETGMFEGVKWSTDKDVEFKFHECYRPVGYCKVASILTTCVKVTKDFLLYDFYIMTKRKTMDALDNTWVTLSFNCRLNTLDLLELDETGKAHMYILDNFKDVNKQDIYTSFMRLPKNAVAIDTMLRVIEKVQPESTKWFEDYIFDAIGKRTYFDSKYIDAFVKYVRVAKKSKDKDIERILDAMLHLSSYAHYDGYVRVIKAIKPSVETLNDYVQRVIDEDKATNSYGHGVSTFLSEWKTESFQVLEDYLLEGIRTQAICDFKDTASTFSMSDEYRSSHGLYGNYDFVKNYLQLLLVKGMDKLKLVSQYVKGMEEYATKFPANRLLHSIDTLIHNHAGVDLIPIFVQCIEKYDTYGEYADKYISKEKKNELGLAYSFYGYEYYMPELEPYAERLIVVAKRGSDLKKEETRKKQREALRRQYVK